MTNVSVIVPVYNASKVIDRCLESLFCQTLTEFEIIFVNDCSYDGTLETIRTFIAGSGRSDISVKIIEHTANRGVAAARNSGLDNASGEFVYSVDADDYVDRNTLKTYYDEAVSNGADIVTGDWFLSFEHNERHIFQADAADGKELFANFAYGVARWNLWLFFIRRELIERWRLRFTEGVNMGEDMMMMMKLSTKAGKVSVVHTPMYHYVQTNGSAMTKSFKDSIAQVNSNVIDVEEYLVGNNETEFLKLLPSLKLSLKLPLLISNDRKDYEQWQKWFPDASGKFRENPVISKRIKLVEWAAYNRLYFIVRLHNWVLNKVIYGLVYR